MNRTRALIVSLAVGLAAIAGVFALDRHAGPSKPSTTTTDQQVEQRTQQLNRYEASLRKTLAQKPPALPAVPVRRATARPIRSPRAPRLGALHPYGSSTTVPRRSSWSRTAADDEDEHEADEENDGEYGAEYEEAEADD